MSRSATEKIEQVEKSYDRTIPSPFSHPDEAAWASAGANYPRKQMRRQNWTNLNGKWNFVFDNTLKHEVPSDIKDWTYTIKVPFAPESRESGIFDQGFHKRCWYQRKFNFNLNGDGRAILHFGAVDYEARVWINDHYVGSHLGGHVSFSFDITEAISSSGEQVVTVCADDDPLDLAKPRGKQDWQLEPHSIWYPRTTGIWQTVWLEEVPHTYIKDIRWTPLLERWEIGCEVFLGGEKSGNYELEVTLMSGEQLLASDRYQVIAGEVHRRISLSDPGIDDFRNELLWSPEKPTLIHAHLKLSQNGRVLDQVRSYTALRSVDLQRDRFVLNGRPYFLRLVLDQGYWPDTLMTPPSDVALIRDILLVKAAGFNGVRKHQKVEDPDFLYWADTLGLMVWEEMPSAYRFTNESVQRLTREWTEVIQRDANHPCIIVWVPFNESWGVPDLVQKVTHRHAVQAMYHLTKTLDPTRPVVGNDGWESTATDIMGIHDYDSDPKRLLERYGAEVNIADLLKHRRPGGRLLTIEGYPHSGQPMMLTEFGGIAFVDENRNKATKNTWGYSVGASATDLARRYQSLMKTINSIELFSGFCYTQFTDTFQEANGLFYADRSPKIPLEALADATKGSNFNRDGFEMLPPPLAPLANQNYLEPQP